MIAVWCMLIAKDSAWHEAAYGCIELLAQQRNPWAIPWPCIHEFLAIVTHYRIYKPPTPLATALDQVDAWLESPSLVVMAETEEYWQRLEHVLRSARPSGPKIHDARIVALCLEHGIAELWTADRDFSRFSAIKVRNPLVG